MKKLRIYLDVCCLNRPFDDQTQNRIHFETEAVEAILYCIISGEMLWVGSEIVTFETAQIRDLERKARVLEMLFDISETVWVDDDCRNRAKALVKVGFGAIDALHLVCAEKGGADVLLTTDDQFVKIAEKNKDKVKTMVRNPLAWFEEEMIL